jgi:uncharacterized ferritin-like protein (DUF455 family)
MSIATKYAAHASNAPHEIPTVALLRQRARHAFALCDASEKSSVVRSLLQRAEASQERVNAIEEIAETSKFDVPGRPLRPTLVSPRELHHRSLANVQGRAILIHAIAHIEFNAINLALDAMIRFANTPDEFVRDWASVASEEALHFSLLREHLRTLGYDYGDFPAHDGLWEMAEKTKHDLLARLALVPRTLEARGLDVSPAMRDKLKQAGDMRGAEILDVILRDEIGHVAIGNKWFRFYCEERSLNPVEVFERLSSEFDAPTPRAPFNVEARLQAGFTQEEIERLQYQSQTRS